MAVGRFAPSPTGPLHVGNLRTALLAWLCARSAGSRFVLRVEDLDVAASRAEHESSQLADLRALGIDWDGPVVHQSGRGDAYASALDRLEALGLLYSCFCTRREIREAASAPHGELPEGAYPGTCRDLSLAERSARTAAGRPPALRVRAAGERRRFRDRLHGAVEGPCDDFVVRRNDGTAAYNLAVVVDDADAGVEEVVRGDDLLDSTPRQVLVAELLDLPVPTYAHVPLVLGPDGERLAKRHGAVTLGDRLDAGWSTADVLEVLAASLGAAVGQRPAPPTAAADLLDGFALDLIPRSAWVLPDLADDR